MGGTFDEYGRMSAKLGLEVPFSNAAISTGHNGENRTFTEEDWTPLDKPIGAYPKSKTLAERAAWDFINGAENIHKMELVTINPPYILGPLLNKNFPTSGELIRTFLRGEVPGVARIKMGLVDVRDVAAAHIAAMTTPEAAGQRFACVNRQFWLYEAAQILNKHFSTRGYKIPTMILPSWLVRIVAIFLPPARSVLKTLDRETFIDSTLIRKTLKWKPLSLEQSFVDMAESMIELKLV
jgi:nucleoside-diphosphate-sugar epimerase